MLDTPYRLIAIALLSVTASGCLSTSYDSNSVSNNTTNSVDSTADAKASTPARQDSIRWLPCTQSQFADWFITSTAENAKSLQCATLDIPIKKQDQQAKPDSQSTVIRLALTRLPATGSPEQRLGALINVAGGPGESTAGHILMDSDASSTLSKHFDMIGFAPRGIAPSTPAITCKTDVSKRDDEWSRGYTEACWEQTPHDLLAVLGSDHAVEDIEAIRQAIDEPKISLIAYSYGTQIATLYAERYPEHLRAGVLDGLINLEEPRIQSIFNQHAMMQKTFEDFVAYCKQDSACYYADTDTIEEAEEKTARLFKYLEDNEVSDSNGEVLMPYDLTLTISTFLSMPQHWDFLNGMLVLMDKEQFDMVSDIMIELNNNIYSDAFGAISCANHAPTTEQRRDYLKNIRQVNDQSTWDNYRYFEDDELLGACYYWPIAGSNVPHTPKLSPEAPPLLLVAQTADFNTPYSSALAMQKYLKATLLTRESNGHVVSLQGVSDCVDNKVVDYLLDPIGFDKREDDNLTCD